LQQFREAIPADHPYRLLIHMTGIPFSPKKWTRVSGIWDCA
jgi:hypothetical protein